MSPYGSVPEEYVLNASASSSNLVLEGSVLLASKLQSSGGSIIPSFVCLLGNYSIVSSFFFFFFFFVVVDVAAHVIGLGGEGREK